MNDETPGGPLAGYRVLELTTTVAGPFCGRLLADFGAEVIKVERPHGDDLRTFGKTVQGKSLYAGSLLRNKALIAVDLRKSEGQEVIHKLVPHCDVVVENFRPGTLERWRLGFEQLSALNPALVMVRISGFGQSGPYSKRPGYGIIAEALSGLRHLTGHADAPPPRVAVALTDYIAGIYAAFGAMVALHHARNTGQGQVVDAALYESAFSVTEQHVPAYGKLGEVANRHGHRLPSSSPNNLYYCQDGRYILITAHAQSIFTRLCEAMGKPELVEDSRFSNAEARSSNEDALDDIISAWSSGLSLEEAESVLHEAEIPASRVFDMADIFADPHYRAREMLTELPDEELGSLVTPSVVPKLSATPGKLNWSGRHVGEDTEQVLTELAGLSRAEVDRLEAGGIVTRYNGGGTTSNG
ncbi:MAG: CaiB/BaiF CoA-transferase family protein [SAR324 cluster bacterium]|nr:CaiB/BaiF CoA-transferase family protein [SAR324 cluster bacterium]